MKKKKYVNPMQGRKISEEDRGEDAPKLGRPFLHENAATRYVVSVSVPENMMAKLLKKMKTTNKGTAVRKLIEENFS